MAIAFGGPKEGQECWVLTYYGTGMSASYDYFDNEEDALKAWERFKDDPWKSVSSLKKETILRRR